MSQQTGAALSIRRLARTLSALIVLNVGSAALAQRIVDQSVVIENVTLISPERAAPLRHADVVIRDGRISEIGTNLHTGLNPRRIDGGGRFLIPGLIDSHVHAGHSAALDHDAIDSHPELWAAYRAQVPRAYLAFGFTSIVDLDLTPSDQAWFEGTPLHPRFYSCGRGIKVAGGYMAFNVPLLSSQKFPNLVYEPKEAEHWPKSLDPADYTAERAVSRAADAGVDGFGNPPGLNGRLELQNWADAGAPLALILRAATLDNATALGLSHELGSIEVGKKADLLMLKENPLTNVSAYDSIETIFLNGEPIAREALRAEN